MISSDTGRRPAIGTGTSKASLPNHASRKSFKTKHSSCNFGFEAKLRLAVNKLNQCLRATHRILK